MGVPSDKCMSNGEPSRFKPGQSGNPNGKPSVAGDLKRARDVALLVEAVAVLDAWKDDAEARLAELGPVGFIAALRDELAADAQRNLPLTPQDARALWWRTVFPVFLAGPRGSKDTVWTYASGEIGARLLGKPKEHVVFEDNTAQPPIDWAKVPPAEREQLLFAIERLVGYMAEPATDTEH